ncbi:MAG: LLM class flavin-dependent oxidoreductase [Dehalococcoidia bacterium]
MPPRRLSISLPWNPRNARALLDRARVADDTGVETIWINEGFGHDAFSGLTLLAWETMHARLGTSIVNVYSRTPGALAQHFATLDQLSNGRVIVGLGTSGPGVVERFHGMRFQPSLQRLRDVVTLIRAFWRHDRVTHHGAWFDLDRAVVLGVDPVQAEPPIFLATLHPRSVRLTAEVADGWLPAWIPIDRLADQIAQLRTWAREAGRDPAALTVRAPGSVTVVDNPARAEAVREARRRQLAFFVARNGDFYYRQFLRHGHAVEAAAIRRAWNEGGPAAGTAEVGDALAERFDFAGSTEACIDRIEEQAAAGVDLHQVMVASDEPAVWRRALERLIGA